MPRIDPNKTVAILIGVSEFRDKSFINASPIKNNVTKIKELLQDNEILGLEEKKILVLDKNERHDEILDRIEDFLEQNFVDTVIFYFAGHGYKTDKGDFYLVTNNSNIKHLNISAISWDSIKEILEKGSGIQQRFYILDTCHSGAATLGESDETLDIEDGSALLAAAKADRKAYFNENEQYTYFTDAFINILENGIPNYEEPDLAIRPIFQQLDKNLKDRKIEVTIKSAHKIDDVSLFKNKGFDKAELMIKQARSCFELGNYSEAIRNYRDAISEFHLTKTVAKNRKKIKQIEKEIDDTKIYLKAQEKFLHNTDSVKEKETVELHSQEINEVIDQSASSHEEDSRETVTEEIGLIEPEKKTKQETKAPKTNLKDANKKIFLGKDTLVLFVIAFIVATVIIFGIRMIPKRQYQQQSNYDLPEAVYDDIEPQPVNNDKEEGQEKSQMAWVKNPWASVDKIEPQPTTKDTEAVQVESQMAWVKNPWASQDNSSLKDIDGNEYSTVKIGNQLWMAENLKVTKYNDGAAFLYNVTDNDQWTKIEIGAYCLYGNNINYRETYGALYNWYAVETGKLCPAGWHVPFDSEWVELTNFLGGEDIAGGKLKESGTIHWAEPNTGANNQTGFSALPGGIRNGDNGTFSDLGYSGYWWSRTGGTSAAWLRALRCRDANFHFDIGNKTFGCSVRCVRDN